MTNEEILAMKAGVELNDLVGKTLGFTPRIEYWVMNSEETAMTIGFEWEKEAQDWLNNNIRMFPNGWVAKDGYHVVKIEIYNNFSANISAAWEIVVKLQDDGILVRAQSLLQEFEVTVFMDCGDEELSCVRAVSAPEAICKATLLAVMELK